MKVEDQGYVFCGWCEGAGEELEAKLAKAKKDTARLDFARKQGWLRRSRRAIDKAMKEHKIKKQMERKELNNHPGG